MSEIMTAAAHVGVAHGQYTSNIYIGDTWIANAKNPEIAAKFVYIWNEYLKKKDLTTND